MKLRFTVPRWFWLADFGIVLLAAFGLVVLKGGPLAHQGCNSFLSNLAFT